MTDRRRAEARGHDRVREALGRGLIALDAAMGTRLIALGLSLAVDDPCLWNLSHPEAVVAIHRRDAAAGAEALLTNTFGANRAWLARRGQAGPGQVATINRAAVALARRAAGPDRFVVGDIGPTAVEGDGDSDALAEQAAVLIDAGVDALILETFRLDRAEAALRRIGPGGTVPLLVSLIDWPDQPDEAVARLVDLGADALGGNCQNGMTEALGLAERLRPTTPLPLIVKPAAGRMGGLPGRARGTGTPEQAVATHPDELVDGPEEFGCAVPRLKALAPVLVGGCCGTSEAHVGAIRAAWYDVQMSGM